MKLTKKNIVELLKNQLGAEIVESMEDKELNKLVKAKKKELEGQTTIDEVEEVTENKTYDLNKIVGVKFSEKKSLTFNQDKSVADKIRELANESDKKPNQVFNLLIEEVVDIRAGKCKIDVSDVQEEKEQTTFRLDKEYADVLEKEAKLRNMSISEYINRVLKVMFK